MDFDMKYVRKSVVMTKGGATVGQWGQTAPTGMRLWGQNYVFAPTENQQVLNEECLFTQEQI